MQISLELNQEFNNFVSSKIRSLCDKELKAIIWKHHIKDFLIAVSRGRLSTQRSVMFNKSIRYDLQVAKWGAFSESQMDIINNEIKRFVYTKEDKFVVRYNRIGFEMEVLFPECLELIAEDLCGISEDQASSYFKHFACKDEMTLLLGNYSINHMYMYKSYVSCNTLI